MYPFLELCCYNKIAKLIYEKLAQETFEISCCNCYHAINDKFTLLCEQDTALDSQHSFLSKSTESRLIILQLIKHQLCIKNPKIFHECEANKQIKNEIKASKNLWLQNFYYSLEQKRKTKEINTMLNALEITFLRYENPEQWEREKKEFYAKYPHIDSLYDNCKKVHWHIIRNDDYGTSTLYSLLIQLLSLNF